MDKIGALVVLALLGSMASAATEPHRHQDGMQRVHDGSGKHPGMRGEGQGQHPGKRGEGQEQRPMRGEEK